MVEHVWHDASLRDCLIVVSTDHRIRLTAACLAVCKHCSIIPCERTFDYTESRLAIDILLRRELVEDSIVPERFVFLGVTFPYNRNLICVLVDYHTSTFTFLDF
jgi:hypothetical protein